MVRSEWLAARRRVHPLGTPITVETLNTIQHVIDFPCRRKSQKSARFEAPPEVPVSRLPPWHLPRFWRDPPRYQNSRNARNSGQMSARYRNSLNGKRCWIQTLASRRAPRFSRRCRCGPPRWGELTLITESMTVGMCLACIGGFLRWFGFPRRLIAPQSATVRPL